CVSYVSLCVCVYLHVICLCVCVSYVSVCVCVSYVSVCVCVICLCVCVCVVCICVCVCVICLCVCVCVCTLTSILEEHLGNEKVSVEQGVVQRADPAHLAAEVERGAVLEQGSHHSRAAMVTR